jgi:hypothetical protein
MIASRAALARYAGLRIHEFSTGPACRHARPVITRSRIIIRRPVRDQHGTPGCSPSVTPHDGYGDQRTSAQPDY